MPDVDFHVFFQSDFSTAPHIDPGFGRTVAWDVPLTDGYPFTVLPPLREAERPGGKVHYNSGLFNQLKKHRADVLWVHGYAHPYYIWVIERALGAGLKVIVRDDGHARANRRQGWREALKRHLITSWSKRGARFLAVGSLNRDYYVSLGASPSSVHVAPYAVDNTFFERLSAEARASRAGEREKLGIPADATVILSASKLLPRKNTLDLVAAFEAALPKLTAKGVRSPTLVIAGSGPEEEQVLARIQGLPAVYLGFCNQEQMARLFGLSDVFVLPSRHEPWGLVVNEAMAAGLAILVSDDVGCWPDLVKPGENGLVFPTGDVDAFALAIEDLLSNTERLAAMGQKSREIIGGWSFDEDVRAIAALFNDLAS
jgi:glycosyltransferase involved in cell wall biosynthesis